MGRTKERAPAVSEKQTKRHSKSSSARNYVACIALCFMGYVKAGANSHRIIKDRRRSPRASKKNGGHFGLYAVDNGA